MNIRQSFSPKETQRLKKISKKNEITEYIIPINGLKVLYIPRIGTGVVTTNIVYHVGSRDEGRTETGLAHMLEHMLFKPTKYDIKRKTDSGAMLFERETGITLNANTWKDRTSYFFSYPKEHFDRALQIESERMQGVTLTDKEFLPERANVLSEYDMYAGDEEFLLSKEMMGSAFHSHPYGHETIGFREDISSYTVDALRRFYLHHYGPNNATLIVCGDVSEKCFKKTVLSHFGHCKPLSYISERTKDSEPKQLGIRTVSIEQPSEKQIYAIGIKHAPFPTKEWFESMVIFDMLACGEDSVFHRHFVDKGYATHVQGTLEPTKEKNLGILFLTLTQRCTHTKVHDEVIKLVHSLSRKDIHLYLQKIIAKTITAERTNRDHSLGYVSELVEYVSAGAWDQFFESERILRSITAEEIQQKIMQLFKSTNITIGNFIGKK